jgi:glycosyltransferase involved in cell wall biosynthesis
VSTRPALDRLEIFIDGLGLGGAESLLVDMLPTFVAEFQSVEIITLHGTYDLDARFVALAPVTKVSLAGMMRRLRSASGIAYVNLAKAQTAASLVAVTRRGSRAQGRRLVCHEHASFDYYSGRRGLQRVVDAAYRRLTRHCIRRGLYDYVVSTRARFAEVAAFGGDLSNVLLLPNSVSAVRMNSLRACRANRSQPGTNDEPTRFLTLSRLHSVKQIDWAIDAVAELARAYPDRPFALSICGRGPDRQRLDEHSRRYSQIPNLKIDFAGFVATFEEAAAKADYFLLPSKHEGFPVGLTEAALTGITAIANDCPHGPADLAEHFTNVHLASPPSHDVFVRIVRDVVGPRLAASSGTPPAEPWPSLEQLTSRLIAFMRRDSAS